MSIKTACLILASGDKYQKIGKVAADSFKKWHPDVDLYFINNENEKDYFSYDVIKVVGLGIFKFVHAAEIMKLKKYDKIILLGSDTITCSRLDEFMDNNHDDFLVTLDYPYQFNSARISSPDDETHLNADVICFNNVKVIYDMVRIAHFHKPSGMAEQGGVNEIAWSNTYDYSFSIVDGPYQTSKVVYNARAKGDMCLPYQYQDYSQYTGRPPKYPAYEKPWAGPLGEFYVEGDKLFTGDGKQIKVWHYCDGFGALDIPTYEKLVNNYISNWFNKDTKSFFKQHCAAEDFFEKDFFV